jgi:hypothetical protein
MTAAKSQVLLAHYLKQLKLPSFLREYDKLAVVCRQEQADYQTFLLRLAEIEIADRERRAAERRVKEARLPVLKTLDTFDFKAQPSLNQALVRELLRGEYLDKRENVLLIGNSGTGKTHLATALAFTACQQGRRARFFTVTGLVQTPVEKCGGWRPKTAAPIATRIVLPRWSFLLPDLDCLGLFGSLLLEALLALAEPVALAVSLEDMDPVREPVEQRAGQSLAAHDLGPALERQVGGHDQAGALVGATHYLEKQFRAGLGAGHVAL